jgi:hypothetical protein
VIWISNHQGNEYTQLRVPVLPAEKISLSKQNAANCSPVGFRLLVRNWAALAFPKGIFDGQAVMEMFKVNLTWTVWRPAQMWLASIMTAGRH